MSLATQINNLATRLGTEFKTAYGKIGTLANLTTSAKTDLVSAINEVKAATASASGINDATTATSTTWSSSKISAQDSAVQAYAIQRSNHTGTQTASTISDFSTAADARITAQKGAANGLATLDSSGLVPSGQLPSFVDDVLEYNNLAAFPATGTAGKIYVALDTNKTYRWGGSAYTEISPSPGSTDAVPEGSTNLYFTNARASAAAPVQSVAGKTGAVTLAKGDVGLANVDNTSDANKPVSSATATALANKLSIDTASQGLTGTQQANGQTNLNVYSKTDVGDPATDFVSTFNTALT